MTTAATIDLDPPCRLCQYNLRGLSEGALCPECGTPVRLSILGDRLRNSNPVYVWALRRGALCVLWAMLVDVVFMILSLSLFRVFPQGTLSSTLISLALSGLNFYGIWTVTTPDPGGLGENEYGGPRRFVRFTAVVSLVQIVSYVPLKSMTAPPAFAVTIAGVRGAVSLLHAVAVFAMLTYLSKLATRLPDDRIARRAWRLRFTFGGLFALFTVINVVESFGILTPTARFGLHVLLGFTLALAIIVIPMLIFGVTYLLVLDGLAHRLRTAARDAERLWGAAVVKA